jgi:lactoylglutathione lyase
MVVGGWLELHAFSRGFLMITKLLHTRMRVNNLDETIRFYRDILGLEVIERHRSPRGSELAFLRVPNSDEEIELCSFPSSGEVRVPEDLVHLAFEVDDLDRTMAELTGKGIPITDGPTTTSSGNRFCFIDAPDKYEIELIERPRSIGGGSRRPLHQ